MKINNNLLIRRKSDFIALIASAAIVLAAILYTKIFYEALISEDWYSVDGFRRIVIPDTFLYKNLLESEASIYLIAFSGIKNSIGPSLIWFLAGMNWYVVVLINAVFVYISLKYLVQIGSYFYLHIHPIFIFIILLGVMPTAIYYSIGSLKELPMICGFTGFFYHYLKRQKVLWVTFFLLLVFFRYQIFIPLIIFVVLGKYSRRPLRVSIFLVIFISSIYPYIRSLNIFSLDSILLYREDSLDTSGALIELIRDEIPGLSSIAILVRVIQSVFEPILIFIKNPTIFEDGGLSIYTASGLPEALVMAPFWILAGIGIMREIVACKEGSRDIQKMYALIVLFAIPVGGFSFIHHRYLFPITGIVMMAGLVTARDMKNVRHKRNS